MKKKKISNKEMIELFVKYSETKDINIRDQLVIYNLHIAEILTKKYANRGIDFDDIYQVASLGLILAVERFDYKKGFAFSSFATPTIIGEIKRYFRDKGWMIRVPRRLQEMSKKVHDARLELEKKLQRPVKLNDIAKHLNISEEQVMEAIEAGYVYSPKSLDMTIDGSENNYEMVLSNIIGEEDKNFEMIEKMDFIDKSLINFTELERKILKGRFFDEKTQLVLSKDLGLSQMTLSRIERKILNKLKIKHRKKCK